MAIIILVISFQLIVDCCKYAYNRSWATSLLYYTVAYLKSASSMWTRYYNCLVEGAVGAQGLILLFWVISLLQEGFSRAG